MPVKLDILNICANRDGRTLAVTVQIQTANNRHNEHLAFDTKKNKFDKETEFKSLETKPLIKDALTNYFKKDSLYQRYFSMSSL